MAKKRFVPSAGKGYSRVKAERDALALNARSMDNMLVDLNTDLIQVKGKHKRATEHVRSLVLEIRKLHRDCAVYKQRNHALQAANDDFYQESKALRARCTNANAVRLTAETEAAKTRHDNKRVIKACSAAEFEARELKRLSNKQWWFNAVAVLVIIGLIVKVIG